jgi:hypothetical protein
VLQLDGKNRSASRFLLVVKFKPGRQSDLYYKGGIGVGGWRFAFNTNSRIEQKGQQQIPAARREPCIVEVEAPVNMPLDERITPNDVRWALRIR